MKAIVLREPGGVEVLKLEDVPRPEPGGGEVLVRLQAAAINRRDLMLRARPSSAERMPFIPGSDGAGEIVEVGLDVSGLRKGDRVVVYPSLNWGIYESHASPAFEILGGPRDGTFAEYVRLPQENVFTIPEHLSLEAAAAIPIAGLTAWRAVVRRAQLTPGERVFIPGIGSGAAIFALQIARLMGGRVFITSHSPEKLARALELGAEAGADYTQEGWTERIREASGGGVEVVVDCVGSATFSAGLELLNPGGRLVTFGATTGSTTSLEIRQVYWNQISVLGTTMGSPKEFSELLQVVANGQIHPIIDRIYPLKEMVEAQRRMEEQEQFGKVVLKIY
jgi:zinc-binding alcohol dehydrogenase/oxidoreductase